MVELNGIPLRERKHAQTKIALLNAALKRLRDETLAEISVKDICDTIPVSEVTFYNYFPKKSSLLTYFIRLWTIEIQYNSRKKFGEDAGLEAIEEILEYTAKMIRDKPYVIGEIIVLITRSREKIPFEKLSIAEKITAYPDKKGIEEIDVIEFPLILKKHLKNAIKKGDLPIKTDLDVTLHALLSIFFGTPLMMEKCNPRGIKTNYSKQLKLIWAGIRSEYGGNK